MLKDWKLRVDNRGHGTNTRHFVIGWGRTYNDESLLIEYSIIRKKYIPIFDDTIRSKELGVFNTQSEAIKVAKDFMRSH